MIDPITAITMATAAFNGVKKLVQAGKEFEQVVGQLGKWYNAAADFQAGIVKKKSQKPKVFGKRGVRDPTSIEAEALHWIAGEEAIAKQERELRSLITLRYGIDAYNRMMQKRVELAKERAERDKAEIEARAKFWDDVMTSIVILVIFVLVVFGLWTWLTWEIKQPEPIRYKKQVILIDRKRLAGIDKWQMTTS